MTAEQDPKQRLARKRFFAYNFPYLILYVLTIALVGWTMHNEEGAAKIWQFTIPVIALVSILGGWRRGGIGPGKHSAFVFRQILHWAALVVVIQLIYLPSVQGFLNNEAYGFLVICLIGLTAVLSGVHFDWKMALYGAFVLFTGVLLAMLEDNMMMILMVMGVGLVALTLSLVIRSRIKTSDLESA